MRVIEGHKVFPYIAWGTFILFAAFTAHLAFELQKTAAYLDTKVHDKVTAVEETEVSPGVE